MKRTDLAKPIPQVTRRRSSGLPWSSMLRSGRLHFSPREGERNQCGIAMEKTFNQLLCLERRRSERTGDPFVLMVMELDQLLPHISSGKVEDLCDAIRTDIRETDFVGWYLYPTTIGMIFTTLRSADRNSALKALTDKTFAALSRVLDSAEQRRVVISFHFFPEGPSTGGPTSTLPTSDETLYPDLKKRDASGSLRDTVKRVIDIGGSLGALTLFALLFAAVAALIKLTSKGPVFFHQKRLGKFGKEFDFLKFRTMYVNCDHHIHQQYVHDLILESGKGATAPDKSEKIYKIINDPRVTPLGRFLRKTSIDELPQLINVLKGEMSLVGPRPPIPYEVSCYRNWHRRRVVEVKPGITGLWQVNGRSKTTFDDMVRLDLQYVRTQSIWLDLKILLKTPLAVLTGSGAY